MKLNELTIKKAADGLKRGDFSARELLSDCLNCIGEKDSEIRAFLTLFADEATEEAKKADEDLETNRGLSPLFGIPLAVKDNILIKNKKTTAGSKILENFIAPYSSGAIDKLKKQGAIILGKTNLDEFAMGSSTENSAFGPSRNPRDTARVPGGSSGGSAAAVAANMCLGALGSDTGGSIRQPASFCGIVGLKPTYGGVSRHGLIAMASSLDQIGPFAKTVEDAALIFSAIAGEDNFDSTAARGISEKRIDIDAQKTMRGIKIGIPREYFLSGLDKEVGRVVKSALKQIEDAGAEIKEINLPHVRYSLAAYYIITPAEVSANMARFDGVRYGYSDTEAKTLFDVYAKSRAAGLGPEVKRRIMLGTYVLSAGYYDAYYLKAQKVRRLIRNDFEKAFKEVDFLIGPTTPDVAFKFGEKKDDPLQMYLEDIYTVAINLAGVPALSMPAGYAEKDGVMLPVGMQVIGKWFDETKLLGAAELIEKLISRKTAD